MNLNNVFGGILASIMAMSMIFLFWTQISTFLASILAVSTEVGVFLEVAFVAFIFVLGVIVPINMASSDDYGNQ